MNLSIEISAFTIGSIKYMFPCLPVHCFPEMSSSYPSWHVHTAPLLVVKQICSHPIDVQVSNKIKRTPLNYFNLLYDLSVAISQFRNYIIVKFISMQVLKLQIIAQCDVMHIVLCIFDNCTNFILLYITESLVISGTRHVTVKRHEHHLIRKSYWTRLHK